MLKKEILDPCCGSRMFWFDKNNPSVVFGDIRNETHTLCDGRKLSISPDQYIDFTAIPYPDSSFKLIVLDPPHLDKLGKTSWMGLKYGVLGADWKEQLTKAFNECMRVLEPSGVLIFKWNEAQIRLVDVLPLFKIQPLFGHTSGRHGKTIWLCFMKTDLINQ